MKLIDKDTLVAEIKNIRKHYIERDDFDNGWNFALDKVLSFLDTLEVKEVDLETEIEEQCNKVHQLAVGKELRSICKHFFELGLKAQKGE